MSHELAKFARIIIPSPVKEPLTYGVPDNLRHLVTIGMRVLIPLGKRKVSGIVFELVPDSALHRIKDIIAVLDEEPIVDEPLLTLS